MTLKTLIPRLADAVDPTVYDLVHPRVNKALDWYIGIKNVDPKRFADSSDPALYALIYDGVYRALERRGGINITGAHNLPRKGRYVSTSNHESALDQFVPGLAAAKAIKVTGKRELKTWRYGYVPGIIFERLGAELFEREGSAHNAYSRSAKSLMDSNIPVHSFLERTRKNSFENFTPEEGVAWLALEASPLDEPCPIIPMGLSTSQLERGKPIQMVVGEPIYLHEDPASLTRRQKKELRKEMTPYIGQIVVGLRDHALDLHAKGAGIPHRIMWND